jgi:hypothetical protein
MSSRSTMMCLAALIPALANAQHARDSVVEARLRLYYVGYPIGWESYRLTASGSPQKRAYAYTSDFDYVDRGRRTHRVATATLGSDFTPRQLEIARVADTSRTVEARVDVSSSRATVLARGHTDTVAMPRVAFAIAGTSPVSQHMLLLRYWASHGRPRTLAVVPGGPTNVVTLVYRGRDTVAHNEVLDRYAVDGVTWGVESVWMDRGGRLAALSTTGGGLTLDAIREDLEPQLAALMARGTRDRMADLARISRSVHPVASGSVALVGATLIDGTGAGRSPTQRSSWPAARSLPPGPALRRWCRRARIASMCEERRSCPDCGTCTRT